MPVQLVKQRKMMPKMEKYRPVTLTRCRDLLLTHHYSRRLPASVKLYYGFIDYGGSGELTACITFSLATGRWEVNNLWELTRLVRIPDHVEPLTRLISKAIGYIRANRMADLIVSFADAEEDHHGGIYQSASWVYDGITEQRLDGFNIDGIFVPARTCNQRYGTSSVDGVRKQLSSAVVEPHYDQGKFLYWKALTKEGMRTAVRMGLASREYPKPMLERGTITNADGINRKGRIVLPSEAQLPSDVPSSITKVTIGKSATKKPTP